MDESWDNFTVLQWPYEGSANQQWSIVSLGSGVNKLANRGNGKLLEVGAQAFKTGQVKLKNLSAPNNVQLFDPLFGRIA